MMSGISSRLPEIVLTLKILKNVVALAPLGEHVVAGIELAISICEMAEKAIGNRAAYEELGLRIAALLAGISNIVQKAPEDRLSSVRGNIEDVIQVLISARDTIRTQTSRATKSSKSLFKSFKGLSAEKDQEEIAALEVKISAALERFQVESHIRLELITQHATEMLNEQKTRLAAIQETLSRDAEMARLERITHISSARYDSDELQDQVMTCLEGTRMTLLADLDAWATSSDGAPCFWLNGLAGTGKSTVARTFCERISERKDTPMVLASFFVSRHSTDRRKAVNILHTLVYQLALQDSTIRSSVSQALAEEPDLITRSLSQQVAKLFGSSISGTDGSHPIILVLDALDECEADSQGREGGQLLTLLARSCSESKRSVKLLVMSRLEPTIREMFDEIQTSTPKSEVVQLHDIDRVVVREDIQRYLVHSFNEIARRVKAANWPTQAQVALLLDNADVLFIYAATVVRYIGHRQFDPRKRLEQVLTRTGKSAQSAYRQLDGLYQSVLANALTGASVEAEDEPEIAERLQTMLSTVVLVLQRLSPSTIAGLLDWSVHETELALARLTAVFIIHEDEPVRIFHPSFPDFLLDSSRCTNPRLQVNARTQHAVLARLCLSVMNSLLHKDILDTGLDPLINNGQLHDLASRIEQFMPSYLRYAICFWMNHLVQSALDDELQKALDEFCLAHLFHWLECLSILSKLESALSDLPTVMKFLPDSTPSKDLIADVYHTLREYYSSIRDSASHVYHSALVTMPGCRLHELNSHETGNVALLTARRAAFSPDIMYMQDSITDPTVFALSRDGSRIACYEPHVLWVGNTVSGEMRLLNCPVSTSDPSLRILALQFSLDGRRLSSADNRGIIHVIELEGGDTWTHLPPAKDKDGVLFASSAMFSSGGELCVFNFRLAGLRLQNSPPQKLIPDSRHLAIRQADSGANFYMLPHASSFNLLPDTSNYDFGSKSTFTPDAQCVILASDASIFIWDVARHALRVKISASDLTWSSVLSYIIAVTAVSNTLCASLTLDGTVALWDIVLGVQIRTIIKGNIKSLLTAWALISSSDGGFLGIVLNDTVQVISTAEGHIIAQHFLPPRRGFSDHVGEVGLEFDSRSRLAIAAHAERPIVLWSYKLQANRPPNRITSTAPARNVSRVSFSADGNMLVSDTDDGSITVWKCDTGLPIAHYVGEGVLAAVSLSTPSPRFVISGRETQSVRDPDRSFALQVNDTKTGDVMGPLKSRIKDSMMHAVALSPDDRYLALWFSADTGEVNTTLVVDIHTGQTAARKPDFDKKLRCDPISLSYTPDGLMLVHSGIKGAFSAFKTFIIRDAQTLQARFILDYHNEGLTQTFLSPCSTRVGCVGHDGPRVHLRVWSLESGLELISSPPLEAGHNQHWGLMMPVWTRRQIIWASDESIFTWNLDESTAPVVQGWPRGSTPKSMCVSRDASHIYAWFDDEHIRVWTTADGFVVSGPILELSTSRWPRKVKRSLGRYSSLLSASHHATHLQLILQLGQQYLIVIINLKDGACVRATPFGDGQGMIRPVPILTSNNRIYLRCPVGDKAYLVRWLARIPFNEDDDAAHWFETVTDVSERLQRTLFQVWDLETGEVERIITSSGTQIEFEDLPPSFPLQQSLLQERSNQDIFHSYTPRGARLGVYSTSSMKLVGSLRIPLDRRPAIAGTFDSPNIAVCGTYVAMGSTHGIVSIFDFAKALEAAEARGGVESEAEMPPAE